MSEKLTEQKIESLIFEELEKLNEKAITFGTKKWKTTDSDSTVRSTRMKLKGKKPTRADIDKVAAVDGTANEFSMQDVDDSIGNPSLEAILDDILNNTGGIGTMKTYIKKKRGGGGGSFAAQAATFISKKGLTSSSTKKIWKSEIIDLIATGDSTNTDPWSVAQIVIDEFVKAHYSGALKGYAQQAQNALNKAKLSSGPINTGKLVSMISGYLNKGLEIDDRKDTINMPFGDVDVSGYTSDKGVATAGKFKIDSSVAQVFRTLDGDTMFERLKTLNDSAKIMFDKAAINKLTDQETFKLSSHLTIITKLFNLGKLYDSSGAGFEFEKLIAGIIEGAQVGGENGAVDALAHVQGGKFFSSQKLLASSDVSQSTGKKGSKIGLKAMTASGKSVYYVFGFKDEDDPYTSPKGSTLRKNPKNLSGEARNFRTIWIYLLKVTQPKPDNYDVTPVGLDGNLKTSATYNLNAPVGTKPTLFDAAKHKKHPAFALPLLSKAQANDGAGALAAKLVDSVENTTNNLLKNLMNVQRRLQNMKMNTKEYEATQSGAKRVDTSTNATDYITAISEDYTEVKKEYKDIFKAGTGSTAKTAFKESKIQSLDDLIAETMRDIKRKRKK